MLGTLTLWFGWYGFNAGSALITKSTTPGDLAALCGVNTTLSGGIAGMVALFMNLLILERTTGEPFFDLKYAMNGSLCGLVAITAGCGVLEPWAACIVGIVAGLLYLFGTKALVALRLDDAVDAIPVHMLNGFWGLIANGLFASPKRIQVAFNREFAHVGFVYSIRDGKADATLLGAQLVGALFIIAWVMGIMLPFFIWLDWQGWFRSDPLEEIVGLDTSYHGGLILSRGDDEVNPEYISQFKKKRNELRKRRQSGGLSNAIEETDMDEKS
jgi:ammonium transporter, Amt family